jgi:quinol monooxygenase YgiN
VTHPARVNRETERFVAPDSALARYHDGPTRRSFMLTVFVHVRVKPQFVDAFREASVKNARLSIQEPGVARFDVLQDREDPERWVLVEVYRSSEAPAEHKGTVHYVEWRDAVAPMMAEPRHSVKYITAFGDDAPRPG